MISAEEAWRRIAPYAVPLGTERLPRRDAPGRVLADSFIARVDIPAQDVSAMDGYAVAGGITPGERRPVAGTVAAGDPPGFDLPAGAAARIMTGATLPRAADRVIQVEWTDGGEEEVVFHQGVGSGANVRRRGEILHAGEALLAAGSLLTPGALSLAATHGYGELPVWREPRVAVLTTGDELVPPEVDPLPGQLRDSNTDFLLAAGRTLGLGFASLGIARDSIAALQERIAEGLSANVLLLCGGVSMGEYDLVERALTGLGCETLLDGVAIQPGKPLVVARHPRSLVFGLPGNPASVMVGFWLFVRPALRRMLGSYDAFWHGALTAELEAPLPGAGPRDRFLPAEVAFTAGRILATPLPSRGSHDLAAYARGTALVRVPAGSPPTAAGSPCQVLPLSDWRPTAPTRTPSDPAV